MDFNFEERVEPEIEDKFELEDKLKIEQRIEAEEETEIISSEFENYVYQLVIYF